MINIINILTQQQVHKQLLSPVERQQKLELPVLLQSGLEPSVPLQELMESQAQIVWAMEGLEYPMQAEDWAMKGQEYQVQNEVWEMTGQKYPVNGLDYVVHLGVDHAQQISFQLGLAKGWSKPFHLGVDHGYQMPLLHLVGNDLVLVHDDEYHTWLVNPL